MDWKNLLCEERQRKSTSSGDHRTEFDRDFDRTIFSTPVKRLQDKAQVFPLDKNDAIRTRLTHSLEVSAVARGLAIAIGGWLVEQKEIEAEKARRIEAIAATCGLVHDLGNPPFGHSGEDAIRSWFESRFAVGKLREMLNCEDQFVQDFLKFEGNAQSLRLLTKLQILADFNGLNLTYGTLSACCKYIAPSHMLDKNDQSRSKPGYFASENDIVKQFQKKTGTGDARNPITYFVEAADDIVYSAADIEDAVKKGVVSWREIRSLLRKKAGKTTKDALARMDAILDAGHKSDLGNHPDNVCASAFRTAAIGIAVPAVVEVFKLRYDQIMKGEYREELTKDRDCEAAALISSLKLIGKNKVYCTASTLKLELMGQTVIHGLMDIFWEGAKILPIGSDPVPNSFAGKAGALLSENYRLVFANAIKNNPKNRPDMYYRLQLLTDYICGMTDSFAISLHSELTNG